MEDAARIGPRIYQPAVLTTRPITSAPFLVPVHPLELAAKEYLAAAQALKQADQELDDANAAQEACTRAAAAAALRAQTAEARLTSHARP